MTKYVDPWTRKRVIPCPLSLFDSVHYHDGEGNFTREAHEIVSHRGEYNPHHPGEIDPDGWDRAGYALGEYNARHLLDTGVN